MNYATPQIEELFLNFDMECEKAMEYTKGEYNLMRAGRANPKLVENIKVDYYGAPTPINQMGNISIPEPRCLVISLWDKSALKLVEKAILSANIGVTPQNDGTVIRLTFPVLTEERRKELVKQVKEACRRHQGGAAQRPPLRHGRTQKGKGSQNRFGRPYLRLRAGSGQTACQTDRSGRQTCQRKGSGRNVRVTAIQRNEHKRPYRT